MKNTFQKFISNPAIRFAVLGDQKAVAAALVTNSQRAFSLQTRSTANFSRSALFNSPARYFATT